MNRQLATLVLLGLTTPLAAQWLTLPTPGVPRTADGEADLTAPTPRTADGQPDLSGLWVPVDFAGDLFDPTRVQAWARTLMNEREGRFWSDNPSFLCLPSGPGYLTRGSTSGGTRRIVQSPSMIAFLYSDMIYRQVFMDGRELETAPFPTWMGYSVGRWEGDTLIVESNGYNDKTWLHRRGLAHTEDLRITERYTRSNFGHLRLEITYEDPGTFDEPLRAALEMQFDADNELLESVCNEASKGRSHWGGAITDALDRAVEVAPEILADYVGTYTGYWSGRPFTLEIALEDGALLMERDGVENEQRNGTERLRLIPRSETTFDCSCGWGYTFTRGDDGTVTGLDEVHVSGAWPFTRELQ